MADQFLDLAKLIINSAPHFQDWPDAPWRNLPDVDRAEENAFALFEQNEIPTRPAIEAAIDNWIATGQWPPLNDIQSFFLSVRVDCVAVFLLELSTPDNILKCADIPNSDALRWFLTTWWNQHGTTRHFLNRFD